MTKTLVLGVLASTAIGFACGNGAEDGTGATPMATVSGTYKVSGATVDKQSGQERAIEGTIILAQEGDRYTATFDLDTTYPSPEASPDAEKGRMIQADVIGKGEGVISGNTLEGTAHTQIVMGTVEGVDTAFAFVPRMVGARIVNDSTATIHPDGSITIEIENRPAEGETQYRPTRTTLRGTRVPGAQVAAEGQ